MKKELITIRELIDNEILESEDVLRMAKKIGFCIGGIYDDFNIVEDAEVRPEAWAEDLKKYYQDLQDEN